MLEWSLSCPIPRGHRPGRPHLALEVVEVPSRSFAQRSLDAEGLGLSSRKPLKEVEGHPRPSTFQLVDFLVE